MPQYETNYRTSGIQNGIVLLFQTIVPSFICSNSLHNYDLL